MDRIESRIAVLVPAWFENYGGSAQIWATRGMREGHVYRWNGRRLSRDKAYERRAAAAARALRPAGGGGIRL